MCSIDTSMATQAKQTRYLDRGMLTVGYGVNAICVCPNCGSVAQVRAHTKTAIPFRPKEPRVTCSKCSFALSSNQWKWFGPVVGTAKQPCGNCGFKWLKCEVHRKTDGKKLPSTSSATCETCGETTALTLRWTCVRFGLPHDPVFGLPLWLQISCLGETLWVYNEEHLCRLRAYVAATLRERTISSRGGSIARLPAWMSAAKNRGAVLVAFERLQAKLVSSPLFRD
jgi:hypothetical protein